jgi:S-(hydroxymethyl)glutathione dehydrogenase / alcohol dehydrogenase
MSVQANVAVLPPGERQIRIETVDMAEPGPWAVLVEQRASGVCHSQLDVIDRGSSEPLVLGHESVGRVLATGQEVSHVRAGDEVIITWMPRAGTESRKPVIPRVPLADGTTAVTHNIYTWATHIVVDEQHVVMAPAGTPETVGSIIGCAVMTGAGAVVNLARSRGGRLSIVVWGVGGVGLSAVAAARNLGADPVIAVDVDDAKLRLAGEFGAGQLVNASEVDPVARVRELTRSDQGFEGVDYAFECTGRPECVRLCLAAVRPGIPGIEHGGSAVIVGAPQAPVELDGMDVLIGEKRLVGCLGGSSVPDRDFPTFVDWSRKGQLDLAALVTDRYPLEGINDAVADLKAGRIRGRAILEFEGTAQSPR